jgi:hypothetical protein
MRCEADAITSRRMFRDNELGGVCCGSLVLVEFLAFEADPVALGLSVSAERGGHHGHAAARADRRAVFLIHPVSVPAGC